MNSVLAIAPAPISVRTSSVTPYCRGREGKGDALNGLKHDEGGSDVDMVAIQ
jgi:hypothetical protein